MKAHKHKYIKIFCNFKPYQICKYCGKIYPTSYFKEVRRWD